MRLWLLSPALLSGLRIWHCHELQCSLQTQFVSGIAVAVYAGSYSSNSTQAWELLYTTSCGPKIKKKKKKVQQEKRRHLQCLELMGISEQGTSVDQEEKNEKSSGTIVRVYV